MSTKDQRFLNYAKLRWVLISHKDKGIKILNPTIKEQNLYLVFSTNELDDNPHNAMPDDHMAWYGIRRYFYFTVLCDDEHIVEAEKDHKAHGYRIDAWCYEKEGELRDNKLKSIPVFHKDIDTGDRESRNIFNRIVRDPENELEAFLKKEFWDIEKAILATL
jgi:hypothetical protein